MINNDVVEKEIESLLMARTEVGRLGAIEASEVNLEMVLAEMYKGFDDAMDYIIDETNEAINNAKV